MPRKGKGKAASQSTVSLEDPFAALYKPSTPTLSTRPMPSFDPSVSLAPRSIHAALGEGQVPRPRALSLGGANSPACPPHVLGPLPPVPKLPPMSVAPGSGVLAAPPIQVTQSAPAEVTSFAASRARCRSISGDAPSNHRLDRDEAQGSRNTEYKRMTTWTPPIVVTPERPPLKHSQSASATATRTVNDPRSPTAFSFPERPAQGRIGRGSVPILDQTWARFLNEVDEDGKSLSLSIPTAETMAEITSTPVVAPNVGSAGGDARGPPPGRPLPPAPVAPLSVRRRSRAQTIVSSAVPKPSPLELSLPPNARFVDFELGTITPPISPPVTSAPRHIPDKSLEVVVVTPGDKAGLGADLVADIHVPDTPRSSSSLPYLQASPMHVLEPEPEVVKPEVVTKKKTSLSSASLLGWDYSRAGSEMSLSLFPQPPAAGTAQPSLGAVTKDGKATPASPTIKIAPPPPHHELPTPPITPSTFEFPSSLLYNATIASQSSSTIRPATAVPQRQSSASTLSPSIKSEARSSGSYLSSMDRDDLTSSATTVCSQDPDCSIGSYGLRSSSETDRSQTTSSHYTVAPQTAQKAQVMVGSLWTEGSSPMLALPSMGPDTFSLLSNMDFGQALLELPSTPRKDGSLLSRRHEQLSMLVAADDMKGGLPMSPGSPYVGGVEWGQAL